MFHLSQGILSTDFSVTLTLGIASLSAISIQFTGLAEATSLNQIV